MNTQDALNYTRMARAIDFIQQNFKRQPSLQEIAEEVHLSPEHFQRLFKEWAGISPKKFVQFLTLKHAKMLLQKDGAPNLFQTSIEAGLSSSSRLHELFIQLEAMSPAQYKKGAMGLKINYSFNDTLFGRVILASTAQGLCSLAFIEDENQALEALKSQYPMAEFQWQQDAWQAEALQFLYGRKKSHDKIKLHIPASAFQLKVWQALLNIPAGALSTYGRIAQAIAMPGAARAVGTAIGQNPIAYLIPCHRVIQQSGALGGYRWSPTRKQAMIAWEQAQEQLEEKPIKAQ